MYVLLSLCYYSSEVDDIISQMAAKGRRPSAFIAESLQSCGGQVQRWKQHPQPFFMFVKALGNNVHKPRIQFKLSSYRERKEKSKSNKGVKLKILQHRQL